MSKKFDKDRQHSIIKCSVIDFLIEDIIKEDNYDELSYWNKTAVCILIKKKQYLYGRVLA